MTKQAEQPTVELKAEKGFDESERRDEWRCYHVLHSGEGPCQFVSTQCRVHPCTAEEAAEDCAETIVQLTEAIDGGVSEGDEWFVAVETEPGHAVYFRVSLRIEYQLRPTIIDGPWVA